MACEKCWADAYTVSYYGCESQANIYQRLLDERWDKPCTPEEMCGVGTTEMHTIHRGDTQCACGKEKK